MAHDVFISYSSQDKPIADAACSILEKMGVRCWIAPRDVTPGTNYGGAIVQAIRDSSVLVLILSSNSNQSPQVLREVERAVSSGLPIIPLRVEEVQLTPSMEYYVSSQHWLDAMNPPLENHLHKLGATVKALLNADDYLYEEGKEQPGPSDTPVMKAVASATFESESALDPDQLSDNEFGGGTELLNTGFLVFGILTFWIYTVWVYHGILARHLKSRLEFFDGLLKGKELDEQARVNLLKISGEGFKISNNVKYACSIMYLVCVVMIGLEIIAQYLFEAGLAPQEVFDVFTPLAIAVASAAFCTSSVIFMIWSGKLLKNHEYNESLMLSLIENPSGFKFVRPSSGFIKKWNKHQNWTTLFLVLAVPMTISPTWGVLHAYRVLERGGDYQTVIIVWAILVFTFALIFHLWGIRLLVNMYNEHLSFEHAARSRSAGLFEN